MFYFSFARFIETVVLKENDSISNLILIAVVYHITVLNETAIKALTYSHF